MPSYFDTDDKGRIAQKYLDDDFLDAVQAQEPASTSEVADSVGCTRRNAYERLNDLEDAGLVQSKMIGNSLTWMLDQ